MLHLLRVATGVFFSGFLLTARVALANCGQPEPEILWSFPSDGQTIALSSSELVIYTNSGNAPARVLLNQVLLDRAQGSTFLYPVDRLVLGENRLEIELAGCASECSSEVTFLVVDSPSQAVPDSPTLGPLEVRDAAADFPLSTGCQEYFLAQSCYDQPPYVRYVLDVDADAPMLVVEYSTDARAPQKYLWPVECGPLTLLEPDVSGAKTCITVQGLGLDGSLSQMSSEVCNTLGVEEEQPDPSSAEGCSASRGGATTALFVLALSFRRRTRQQYHQQDKCSGESQRVLIPT